MFTSTTTAVVNSANSFERKGSRPSVTSLRSNSNRRTSSTRFNSPRASCQEQTSGLPKTSERRNEAFQRIITNQVSKECPSSPKTEMLRHELQCRKSVYATLFAVFLIASILFAMLYFRTYDSYIQVSRRMGKNHHIYCIRSYKSMAFYKLTHWDTYQTQYNLYVF